MNAAIAALLLSSFFVPVPANRSTQDSSGRPAQSSKRHRRSKSSTEPATVTLTIKSDPPESKVLVNGEDRGTTDANGFLVMDKLTQGQWDIEVGKPGYLTAHKVFQAGNQDPSLDFKLDANLDDEVKTFNALVTDGKLTGPEQPNAVQLVAGLIAKFPDRDEVVRMRATLVAKLLDATEGTAKKTLTNWAGVTTAEMNRARQDASDAVQLKDDEPRAIAGDLYMEALIGLRKWMDNRSSPAGSANPGQVAPVAFGSQSRNDGLNLAAVKLRMENAAQIDQSWAPPRYQLGRVLLMLNEPAAAESAFKEVIKLEPSLAIAHLGLGRALFAQQKYKEAVDEFQRSLIFDPKCGACYAELGLTVSETEKSKDGEKQATELLEKAMELQPNSGLPHYYLGIIYSQSKKKKDLDMAAEQFKQAIELNKKNNEFDNALAEKMLDDLHQKHTK